jgi:hypothetical protein
VCVCVCVPFLNFRARNDSKNTGFRPRGKGFSGFWAHLDNPQMGIISCKDGI